MIKTNIVAASALFLTAITASASSITMDVNTLDFNQRAGTLFFSENGGVTEISGWAGVLQVKFDGQPVSGYYDTLCVDLFHNISVNSSYTVAPGSVDSIANGGRVAWLYTNWIALGSMQNMAQALNFTTNEVGMALQLAVWDIIHDNGDGLAAGNIRSTARTNGNVITAFQQFQQLSAGQSSADAAIYTDVIGGIQTQRQISVPFSVTPEGQTPEPGTIGLAGLALAALAIARKRN